MVILYMHFFLEKKNQGLGHRDKFECNTFKGTTLTRSCLYVQAGSFHWAACAHILYVLFYWLLCLNLHRLSQREACLPEVKMLSTQECSMSNLRKQVGYCNQSPKIKCLPSRHVIYVHWRLPKATVVRFTPSFSSCFWDFSPLKSSYITLIKYLK